MAEERLCFECRAVDGLIVRLTKRRYDEHVLEHQDLLRDFDYPASEIQKALETAEEIRLETPPKRTYIGPEIKATRGAVSWLGFAAKPRRMHVIVWKDDESRGHVVTAYTVVSAPPKKRSRERRDDRTPG